LHAGQRAKLEKEREVPAADLAQLNSLKQVVQDQQEQIKKLIFAKDDEKVTKGKPKNQ